MHSELWQFGLTLDDYRTRQRGTLVYQHRSTPLELPKLLLFKLDVVQALADVNDWKSQQPTEGNDWDGSPLMPDYAARGHLEWHSAAS